MKIEFTKMHGAGNDYIYIDCFAQPDLSLSTEQIIQLSDRHFGIGSDGVIFIRHSELADGTMDMYNADGSSSAMCGNGVRCVGKYLYDRGYAQGKEVRVETQSGVKLLEMKVSDGIAIGATVNMGHPSLDCEEIPVRSTTGPIDIPVRIAGRTYECTCVSMGNPHAVVFTDSVRQLNLQNIGPQFESHSLFPKRVNTEFVRVITETELEMRVWERGSGETLACGTGACASVVASVLKGFCEYDTEVTVHLLGGDLVIVYGRDGNVRMTGNAVEVFTGTIDV